MLAVFFIPVLSDPGVGCEGVNEGASVVLCCVVLCHQYSLKQTVLYQVLLSPLSYSHPHRARVQQLVVTYSLPHHTHTHFTYIHNMSSDSIDAEVLALTLKSGHSLALDGHYENVPHRVHPQSRMLSKMRSIPKLPTDTSYEAVQESVNRKLLHQIVHTNNPNVFRR